jgi:putative sigma-54 modulation protein
VINFCSRSNLCDTLGKVPLLNTFTAQVTCYAGFNDATNAASQPTYRTSWVFTRTVFLGERKMKLTISGHHIEVTDALKTYVTGKLDKITSHFDDVVDTKVTLSVEKHKEKDGKHAECTLHIKGADLFAESSNADLYAAIDEMAGKLERQVMRHKEKIQDHSKAAAKRVPIV